MTADNNIYIYTANAGLLQKHATIDSTFVNGDTVNFIDLSVKNTYLYALDKLTGVKVFDVSNLASITKLSDVKVEIDGADHLVISGDSVNIFNTRSKSPAINEYIIVDSP